MDMLITILAILSITFIIKQCLNTRANKTSNNPPPSPAKLPVIGNLHQLGRHPHRSLRSLALRHGQLMLLQLGHVPVLIASSAETARDIMTSYDHVFANRPKSKLFEKLLYDSRDIAAAPYGEYWRQMKSICVIHLLSKKMVRSFRNVREEEIINMINTINRSVSTCSSIDLSKTFATLTNDVICRVALGRKYGRGEHGRDFKEFLGEFQELLGGFNVGDYIPWLAWVNRINGLDDEIEKVAKWFDDFLEEVIQEHLNRSNDSRSDREELDFVDALLWIQKDKTVGFEIDRLSVKAIILDVFAAGTDTTFTVIEWAMTELLRHPKAMAKLQHEVRSISGLKPHVSEDDLKGISYLKAVLKETLRLHPPAPLLVPRESMGDVKIQGYDVAAGTQVIINAWAIGREAATWGDDAEDFKPERFLNSAVDFQGRNFELIPFGAGRRGCPGITFATVVDELALANVVHLFDWTPDVGSAGEIDTAESTGLTIHRKFPLVARASPAFHRH